MRYFILILTLVLTQVSPAQEKSSMDKKITKTESEWKEILTPKQCYILRQKGTDMPGEGGYTNHFDKGTYHCAACDAQLFESGTKYESHCGWPSFDDAIEGAVEYKLDKSHGMIRTEIICSRCEGHLGHVFDDGPRDTTGKRYCVNTTSLRFVKS
jgi:peptide-methionine (R)-S-oxide reductase